VTLGRGPLAVDETQKAPDQPRSGASILGLPN
jgi:hypothetical protein